MFTGPPNLWCQGSWWRYTRQRAPSSAGGVQQEASREQRGKKNSWHSIILNWISLVHKDLYNGLSYLLFNPSITGLYNPVYKAKYPGFWSLLTCLAVSLPNNPVKTHMAACKHTNIDTTRIACTLAWYSRTDGWASRVENSTKTASHL